MGRRNTNFPPTTINQIHNRSGGNCEIGLHGCTGTAVEIQHRRARGAGGSRRPETNLPSNGLATCRSCHSQIEGNLGVARVRGWSVRQSVGQPGIVPVLRLGVWVVLDDEGGWVEVEEPSSQSS